MDCATLRTCSPPGSSVRGILQARMLEWVALPCPSPGSLPDPGILPASPVSPALAGGFLTTGATPGALPLSMVPPSCITWRPRSSLDSFLLLLHTQALCRLLVLASKYTRAPVYGPDCMPGFWLSNNPDRLPALLMPQACQGSSFKLVSLAVKSELCK